MSFQWDDLFNDIEQSLDFKLDDDILKEYYDVDGDDAGFPVNIMPARGLRGIEPGKKGLDQLFVQPQILKLDRSIAAQLEADGPKSPSLEKSLKQLAPSEREPEYKESLEKRYKIAVGETEQFYRHLAGLEEIHFQNIHNLVMNFYQTLVLDKNILLNLSSFRDASAGSDYLFLHALNVCIISLNIATASKFSKQQVLEIGQAALLADIGMMLIPQSIRFKKDDLTQEEHYEVQKHPMLGCHLLESIPDIPQRVVLAVYQHHERESGIGYPKQRKSRFIHSYAKIISIADVYEAVSSNRMHREAFIPYRAMEFIVKLAGKGVLSAEKVRNFLRYMSLFPVGSLVQLKSGRVGKVIAANDHAFTRPVVAIIVDEKGQLLAEDQIIHLDLLEMKDDAIDKPLESGFINRGLMSGF